MTAVYILTFLLLSVVWASSGKLVTAALSSNDVVHVRYGYFNEQRPIHAACGRGWLNLAKNVQEDTPEYIVECFPQSSGVYAASRLDNAQLDIASLGSTPWAEAVARGLPLEEIYISHYMGSSQGIYVRSDDSENKYVGIVTPYDLVNRSIGVPFGSTTHYQTLFVINCFGLDGLVKVINLSPTEIIKAWNEKRIDGAACWGIARQHVLDNSGKEMISSQQIGTWGAPTYVNVAARRAFASKHPKFLKHIVGILSRINDSFLDRFGTKDPNNAARWSVNAGKENDQTTESLINPLVDQLMIPGESPGNPSYNELVRSRETLDMFVQQLASEQLDCEYMGDPNGCNKPTGQEQATVDTAKFLLYQKSITTFDVDKSFFDSTYLSAARTGNGVVTPLGSYENETVVVDNEPGNLGPDPVLGDLEKLDPDQVLGGLEKLDIEAGRSQYAKFEVGRAPEGSLTAGDSNCRDDHIIFNELLVNGTIGDGANALPGRSYSDDQLCRWVIHPIGGLVEVRVQRLRLWSGDFLRLYSGGIEDCPGGNRERTLLAQLSGMYDDAEKELPPFRSNTCIVVEFKTDGNEERGYAVTEDFGDGFELFYSRVNVPEGDCNGRDADADGLCLCSGTAWGSDCSHQSYCVGTTKVFIEEGVEYAIQSSIHATKEVLASSEASPTMEHSYPNDLDCLYELKLAFDTQEPKVQYDMIKVELHYDLEDTFDLLTLQTGSGGDNDITQYAILSGSHPPPVVYYVPVDDNGMASIHLTTDDKGRRGGFYAKVSAHSSAATECLAGQSGSQCESKYCLALNRLYQTQHSLNNEFNAGRVISQHSSKAVRAMPWAPDGGCTWEFKPKQESTGSIRLVFDKFDLEPSQKNAVSDKLVIRSNGIEDSEDTLLFIQSCKEDDDCKFEWQTGTCLAEGVCTTHDEVQLDIDADIFTTSVLLATDRNDGRNTYSGIDFEVHYVQFCPAGADNNCLNEGGTCSAQGLCTCSDGIACDCSCKDDVVHYSIGTIAVSSLAILVTILTMSGILHKHYSKELKRGSQIEFLILLLFGLLMVSVGSLLLSLPPSNATCIGSIWFINVGYTTQLVPTIIRVATIIQIVEASKKMKVVTVDKKVLLIKSVLISGVAAMYCAIWTILDQPSPQAMSLESTNAICASNTEIWFLLSFTFQASLLIGASVLSYQMRSVPNVVNDSKQLALMVYSSFAFLVLRFVVYLSGKMVGQATPQIFMSLCSSLDTIFNILIFFTRFFVKKETKKKTAAYYKAKSTRFLGNNNIAKREANSIAMVSESRETTDYIMNRAKIRFAEEEKVEEKEEFEEEEEGSQMPKPTIRIRVKGQSIALPEWVVEKYGSKDNADESKVVDTFDDWHSCNSGLDEETDGWKEHGHG